MRLWRLNQMAQMTGRGSVFSFDEGCMHALTKVNYAVHEACHIVAACWHNLAVDAEIGIDLVTEQGHSSAMTWHVEGSPKENLFVSFAGIEGSRFFHLGEAGLLKDLNDVREISARDSVKRRAQTNAKVFVARHKDLILRMAFALHHIGFLTEKQTHSIYSGDYVIAVPQDFLDLVAEAGSRDWILSPIPPSPTPAPATSIQS